MVKIGFRDYIRKITGDTNIPVDDRIHEVLEVKDDFERYNRKEGNVNDEIAYSEIIERLTRERKEEEQQPCRQQ